jgi:hypothetical protein
MQGHSGAAVRNSGKGAATQGLRLLINPPQLQLDDRTVIFKYTGDGGWFCASFGDGAKYMRAAKEDPALRERIDERAQNIRRGRAALGPDLARIMAAVELSKDYDPDQARDEFGRWTSEGAAAGVAATTGAAAAVADADLMFGNPAYADGLAALAARVLPALPSLPAVATAVGEVAAVAAAPAAFFGTLFFPVATGSLTTGTLPNAPEFSYKYDQDTGRLTVTRQNADGTTETVFSGHHDKDAVFRDEDGNAIGRYLGDSVALDADAVRGYEARRRADAQAPPGAIVQTGTATRSEPKLCPDITEEEIKGRKDRGKDYQSQISGLPPGFDFRLTDPLDGKSVSFDACWEEKNGTMGEAKGPGYEKQMVGPDDWEDWYTGDDQIKKQMASQSRAAAAAGKRVEWHFAELGPADFFRRYVNEHRDELPNIDVFYTPPVTKNE